MTNLLEVEQYIHSTRQNYRAVAETAHANLLDTLLIVGQLQAQLNELRECIEATMQSTVRQICVLADVPIPGDTVNVPAGHAAATT